MGRGEIRTIRELSNSLQKSVTSSVKCCIDFVVSLTQFLSSAAMATITGNLERNECDCVVTKLYSQGRQCIGLDLHAIVC